MNYFFQKFGRILVIWLPLGWLLLFFMLPLVEMINVSFSEARRAVPPYIPAFQIGSEGFSFRPVLDNYLLIYEYWEDYLWPAINSIRLAFFSTLYCLLFAYPMAWWIARSNKSIQHILLILVLMPFWTSSLLRMYALIGLLNPNGFINDDNRKWFAFVPTSSNFDKMEVNYLSERCLVVQAANNFIRFDS